MNQLVKSPALTVYYTQRASGVLLALLLAVHLLTIGYAVQGELSVSEIIDRVRGNLLWRGFYCLFIVTALIHAAIGLRNILTEMITMPRRAVDAVVAVYIIAVLFLGFGAIQAIW